jgi:hypothetical protein
MPNDDVLELVKESFTAEARAITASPALAGDVRRVLRRRRRAGLALAGGTAVAAAAIAGTLTWAGGDSGSPAPAAEHGASTSQSPAAARPSLKNVRYASFTFKVPAQARVSKTCLPGADGGTGAGPRGELHLLVDGPDGTPCVGATIGFTTRPGAATGKVETPGEQTVFLTASAPGTQSGYVVLDERESANAAAAVGGRPGRYYEVFTLPSDTSRSVLIAGLRQYHPVG